MIRICQCTCPQQAAAMLVRDGGNKNVDAKVAEIIADVRRRGDQALFEYTRWFDRCSPDSFEVPAQEIEAAWAGIPPGLAAALEQAAKNIRAFHSRQLRRGFTVEEGGITLGQRVIPLDSVGVYIPGGTASYPSSVLMNIIPARLAGVGTIIMATPPGPDGRVSPAILAAARIAGADRIFSLGGAQAVAALAYGTQTVPAVDKITGPGNLFVATAKRMVFGQVGIDMVAGPSEVLVIADDSANPRWLAMDMLSQAEHDALASAVLITDSSRLAQRVAQALEQLLADLPRADIARRAIEDNSMAFVVPTMDMAAQIANAIAPEHLEIATAQPFAMMEGIRHAGSIFLGQHAPEALGDYFAGPNHTLPTSGTARFSSPLSVDDFVKRSSFISYSRQALEAAAPTVAALARAEGLEAHARSVEIRFEGEEA